MAADFVLRAVMEYVDRSSSGIKKTEQGFGDLQKQMKVASSALGSFDTSAQSAWGTLLQTDRATQMSAQQMGGLATSLGVASSAEVEATIKMDQLIGAWNKGDISSEQLTAGLKELDDGTTQAASGFDKLKGTLLTAGVAMAAIKAGKAAYELAQLGAQSIRTRNAFTAIAGGASEATTRLDAMRSATRGAMSEQQMMASANQLMQMGLAGNAAELEKITTMATRLGSAMGKSAGPAVEEFALLLANQSIPRLDTFGISAGKVRAKMAALAKEFPSMTRETRFMTATMEEGAEAMGRLGDAADDELLAFERLEASMADLKATAGESLAPALSSLLDLLRRGAFEEIPRFGERLDQLAWIVGISLKRAMGESEEEIRAFTEANIGAMRGADQLAIANAEAAGVAAASTPDYKILKDSLYDVDVAADATAGSLYDLSTSASTVAGAFGEMVFDDEQLWNLAMASGASVEALSVLANHLGIATDAEIQNTLAGYGLIEAFGAGNISAEELATGFSSLETATIAAEGGFEGLDQNVSAIALGLQAAGEGVSVLTEGQEALLETTGRLGEVVEETTLREQMGIATEEEAFTAARELRLEKEAAIGTALMAADATGKEISAAAGLDDTLREVTASHYGLSEAETAAQLKALGLADELGGVSGEADAVASAADRATDALNRIPTDIDVTITVTQRGGIERAAGIEGWQHGTSFFPGGLALVGEGTTAGELVALPRGSQVYSAHSPQTRMFRDERSYGGDTVYINDRLSMAMYLESRRQRRIERAEGMM